LQNFDGTFRNQHLIAQYFDPVGDQGGDILRKGRAGA